MIRLIHVEIIRKGKKQMNRRELKELKTTKIVFGVLTGMVILVSTFIVGFNDHNNDKDTLCSSFYESVKRLNY